jgi:hypothetical protein
MGQGRIERYHPSMKNAVRLENHYSPWELERIVARFMKPPVVVVLHETSDPRPQGENQTLDTGTQEERESR